MTRTWTARDDSREVLGRPAAAHQSPGTATHRPMRESPPGLSTRDHAPPDSHPRHRSGAPPHRLGRGGDRGQSPLFRGLWLGCDRRQGDARRAPARHPRRAAARGRRLRSRRSGRGGDLRQQGRGRHAQARPGARHRHAGAGDRRPAGRRIRTQPGEEDHRRRRPQREGADPHDGQACCCPRPTRNPTTPPMRSRSRSATPITGRARSLAHG